MTAENVCFSADYAEAREKFLGAARIAGALTKSYPNPLKGPKGESLSTDIAYIGDGKAPKVLALFSATHGVEGFCGSGAQVDLLTSGLLESRPKDMAILMIHAINCHGFAWIRRTTEENVDLNRNWVDFSKPLPRNDHYDELADAIVPSALSGAAYDAAEAKIKDWRAKNGDVAFANCVSEGQYKHDKGLFFGGTGPTWARRTLETILTEWAGHAVQFAAIDYHTGLGPFGYGELICDHEPETPATNRAKAWWGDSVTEPRKGTSSSNVKAGTAPAGLERALPKSQVTYIALEYGTYSRERGRKALREDAWLHGYGNPTGPDAPRIKAQIKKQFYPDTDDWREAVIWRSRQVVRQAIAGMGQANA
ncbi:MAG: DUF2817 domain-containing protein [Alphaproteobacteria bacterium]|nr:DUF2817 domain-containing protein [Alphaproteobacteria bacterium]